MRYKAIKTRLKLDKDQKIFLLLLMRATKNLYNEALYNVRQQFFKTNTYLTYEDNYHLLKTSENYRTLNSSQAQSVIKKVDEAMKAFFGSIKSKSKTKVRLPRYLDKLGYYSIIDRMVYKPNNNYYKFSSFSLILNIKHYPRLELAIDSVFLVIYFVVHQDLSKFFKSSCRTISLLKSISSILNNSFKFSFAVTL